MHLILSLLFTVLTVTVNCQPEQEITPIMLCASCKGIIKISIKLLNGRTSELDVTDALDRICHPTNFPDFEFPPPYMAAACEKVIRAHYDDIEDGLVARKSDIDLDMKICINDLGVCSDAMDISLKNKDLKPGIDGKFDMTSIHQELKKRGGNVKVAGGGDPDLDLFEKVEVEMKQNNQFNDL